MMQQKKSNSMFVDPDPGTIQVKLTVLHHSTNHQCLSPNSNQVVVDGMVGACRFCGKKL